MTKSVTRHSSPQNPISSNGSGGQICSQISIGTREHVIYASFDRLDKSSFRPSSQRPPPSSPKHTLIRCTCPLRVLFVTSVKHDARSPTTQNFECFVLRLRKL